MSESSSIRMRPLHSASSTSSRASAAQRTLSRATSSQKSAKAQVSFETDSVLPSGKRMLFTGPDETTCHRVIVGDRGKYVGFRPLSTEVTSDSEYLYRASKGQEPTMKMRHERVGEIGWNVNNLWRQPALGKSQAE